MKTKLLAMLLSLGAATAEQTIWVDGSAPTAGADGSQAKPFTTIGAGLKQAKAGTRVLVRGGVYRESVKVPGGAAGAPVTLMAEPGQRVILSGFEKIGGWQPHKAGVFVTTLDWKPDTLYVGFAAQPLAREPNEGWYQMAATGERTITDRKHLASRSDDLMGGSIQFHQRSGNVFFSFPITALDASAGTATLKSDNKWAKPQPGDRYMLKNRACLIDQPGEWAVEAQPDGKTCRLFFLPRTAADLQQTQARRLERRVVMVDRVKHVRLEGLEVAGGADDGIDVSNAADVTITRCFVHNNASAGIHLGHTTDATVSRCLVLHNMNGITTRSVRNLTIEENEVGLNQMDGMDIAGDVSGRYGKPGAKPEEITENVTVRRNYIHHHTLWGHPDNLQLYRGVRSIRFIENLALGAGQGLMTEEVDGGELTGNVILSCAANLIIFGHGNSHSWKVTRNTLGFPGYGIYSFTGTNYDARENIYLGSIVVPPVYRGDYNLYGRELPIGPRWKKHKDMASFVSAAGQEQHSLAADPQMISVPIGHSAIDNLESCTANTLVLRNPETFKAGHHIEINWDGVVRKVTAVDGKKMTFAPPLPVQPYSGGTLVANWGDATDFTLDTRLRPGSPAAKLAKDGGAVGASINVPAFRAGDFDGDGKRDLPDLPADVKAGLPDPNNLILPSF
jgi:hypothetical protein